MYILIAVISLVIILYIISEINYIKRAARKTNQILSLRMVEDYPDKYEINKQGLLTVIKQ